MAFKISQKKNRRPPLRSSSSYSDSRETGGRKQSPTRKRVNVLTVVFIVIALGVFGVSLFNLINIYMDYRVAQGEYKNIDTSFTSTDGDSGLLKIAYDQLTETNQDFVAWIHIPDTPVSYPIVYSSANNDVYLRTTFLGQYATAGSIFIDYRCKDYFSSRVTIIYGHRMNDNTMFSPLKNYLTRDFWEDHREIHIYMKTGIEVYQVFSSYTAVLDDECYAFYFESDKAFMDWSKSVSGKSNYNTGISMKSDSRVIVLSTCVYAQEDNRNVVLAVYDHTLPNP